MHRRWHHGNYARPSNSGRSVFLLCICVFCVGLLRRTLCHAGPAAAEEKDEGPSTVNVVLASFGANKVAVIKVVKELTGLSLVEAKNLVDGAPKAVKEGIAVEEANAIKAKLEEAGATVELK